MADQQDQKHPLDKFKHAVQNMIVGASIGGLTGASWGAVLAALRNESMAFYSASMGANFFLLTSTYIACNEVISDKVGKRDIKTGAASGALTGGFYAGLVGGPLRGVQGALAGAAVASGIFLASERFEKWRLQKGVQRFERKYGYPAPLIFYPNTETVIETKGPVRELAFPSLLPKSIKVTDEEIERRVQVRLQELRDEEASKQA